MLKTDQHPDKPWVTLPVNERLKSQTLSYEAYMILKQLVEIQSEKLSRGQDLAYRLRSSALSRLVWFVVIVGFVILNAKPYWEALHGSPLLGYQIFWLSLPWTATALLAIITHILIDEAALKDNAYYSAKSEALDLHRIDIEKGKANFDEFSAILRDTDPATRQLKVDLDKWFKLAQWAERLTFFMLFIAFISALVLPLAIW